MKILNVFALLILMVIGFGCGASMDGISIDDDTKAAIAIESMCAAAATAGCLDQDEVQKVLGDLKTSEKCVSVVTGLVDKSVLVNPADVVNLTMDVFTCEKFQNVLDSLMDAIPKDVLKETLSDFKN